MSIIKKLNKNLIPAWFMRQAGRYLPEYRELRAKCRQSGMSFIDMCLNKDIATEITLQPIKRFPDISAAIFFSDILIIPKYLGFDVNFIENQGPVLGKFEKIEQITKNSEIFSTIQTVCSNIRNELPKDKDLIGFSGSPFTLACYMIEGSGSKDFASVLEFIYKKQDIFNKLIDILSNSVVDYLSIQIKAGVNLIQLFESHAGVLSEKLYTKYIINPHIKIVQKLKQLHPEIPVICFPKGSGSRYIDFVEKVNPDIISLDNSCDFEFFCKNIPQNVTLQGNLNNFTLCYGEIEDIKVQTANIVNIARKYNRKLIFNLSHGMIKETNPDKLEFVLKLLNEMQNS